MERPPPISFKVGAAVPGGAVSGFTGGGTLWVTSSAVVLVTGRGLRLSTGVRLVNHTDSEVTMIRVRLLPWMNTALLLTGETNAGVRVNFQVVTWAFGRRPLRAALLAAGFRVVERSQWLSVGTMWIYRKP
jgi:hypothetical protein